LEEILFILSFMAAIFVASAGLTGPFVTDASENKASAMPKLSSIRFPTSGPSPQQIPKRAAGLAEYDIKSVHLPALD
jgi:hypothetical protein